MAAYHSTPSFPDIFGEAIGEGTMLVEGRQQIVGPTDFETRFGPPQAIQGAQWSTVFGLADDRDGLHSRSIKVRAADSFDVHVHG